MTHEFKIVKSGMYIGTGNGKSKREHVRELEEAEKHLHETGEYSPLKVKQELGLADDFGYDDVPARKICDHLYVSEKNTSQIKKYLLKDLKIFHNEILEEEAIHDIQGRSCIFEWMHIENGECVSISLRGILDRVRNICNPTGPDTDTYVSVTGITQMVTPAAAKPRMFSKVNYASAAQG